MPPIHASEKIISYAHWSMLHYCSQVFHNYDAMLATLKIALSTPRLRSSSWRIHPVSYVACLELIKIDAHADHRYQANTYRHRAFVVT